MPSSRPPPGRAESKSAAPADSTAPSALRAGHCIAGRYSIEGKAAAGGMSTIYRARDLSSGALVAVKLLPTEGDARRFEQEAATLANLPHAAIVRYLDHGQADGLHYLVMEWLEGETLHERLENSQLSVRDGVALARRVAETLGEAHARGIVHRDIKPANLFLRDHAIEGVTLLDFGIARFSTQAAASTTVGMVMGTPGYMSPEQARGDDEIDARADVFSLGAVLFECLTDRPAFVGGTVVAILAKLLLEEPPHVCDFSPDVDERLDALVARMLSKHPGDRPADGAAVVAALDALAEAPARVPRPSGAPLSLTEGERRFVCVVLASASAPPDDHDAATVDVGAQHRQAESIAAAVAPFGARAQWLADGTFVTTLAGGAATDLATRAARCAFAVSQVMPKSTVALATGRGEVRARMPVGEAIDRAASLLRSARRAGGAPQSGVRVDDVTVGLLSERFEVRGESDALVLVRESEREGARTLLGRTTRIVGRERELRMLVDMLEASIEAPSANMALVLAPAGVGKSRLRYDFVHRIQSAHPDVDIHICRADGMREGSPFGLIAPIVRRAAGILDGEPLEVRQSKLRARVGRHAAASDIDNVVEFLADMIGAPFAVGSVQLQAARRDPMVMGDRMSMAWQTFVEAEVRDHPVLIVLEDIHWGDVASIQFLDSMVRNLHERALMVLATGRPEVRDRFPKLWSERLTLEITLAPLSARTASQLVREVLGDATPPTVVDRIVAHAAGNAFHLEELIRAESEGKGDHFPDTVLATLSARLEALPPELRRTLRACSVFGEVCWSGGVAALLGNGVAEATLRASLDALVEREIISARALSPFPNQTEYVFRHALVRDVAYGMLTDRDREVGHGLAGRWLERAGEVDAAVLAEHFERANERARAQRWYFRAAEQALGGNDYDAVIHRAERIVASGVTGDDLSRARLLQSEACNWRGDFAAAARHGSQALDAAQKTSSVWYAAIGETVYAVGKLSDVATLDRLATQIVSLEPPPSSLGPFVAAASRVAVELVIAGRFDAVDALLARIDRDCQSVLDAEPALAGRIARAQAWRASTSGDLSRTRAFIEASIVAFERAGNVREACVQRIALGWATKELGDYAESVRALRAGLETAQRLGIGPSIANARQNLGMSLLRLGDLEEGRALIASTLPDFRAQRSRRMEAATWKYLAQAELLLGDGAAAERAANEALRVQAGAQSTALAHATLAMVLLALPGREGDALAEARMAHDALEALGSIEEGEAMIRVVYARALAASGDRASATVASANAKARLLARASHISDVAARERFMTSVPENAQTLALAEHLDGRLGD